MTLTRTGISRALAGTTLALASLAGCGGVGTVRYEGDEASRAGLVRADVAVYVVDCAEGENLVCSYQGQPLPWRVIGQFRVPAKAYGKWEAYHERVRERAVQVGCRAVGVRRVPPPRGAGVDEPVGALCFDVSGSAAAPPSPGGFTAPPEAAPGRHCDRDEDCARGQSCMHDVCR